MVTKEAVKQEVKVKCMVCEWVGLVEELKIEHALHPCEETLAHCPLCGSEDIWDAEDGK